MRPFVIIPALAACLALGACTPAEEKTAEEKTDSAIADVKEDAAALAESTGAALKEGAAELKEGVQDLTAMAKDKTADAKADLKDEPGAPEKK